MQQCSLASQPANDAQALVAEMVGNFGKRLKPFDMTVKELTGDMNLSRAEIEDAQVRHSFQVFQGVGAPASSLYLALH